MGFILVLWGSVCSWCLLRRMFGIVLHHTALCGGRRICTLDRANLVTASAVQDQLLLHIFYTSLQCML